MKKSTQAEAYSWFPEQDKQFTHEADYGMDSNRPMTHEERKVDGTTNDPLQTGLVVRQPL